MVRRAMERATGIEPVLPTWELKVLILSFQYLQNHSAKTYVHVLHTMQALPDLRIAGVRLGDVFSSCVLFATGELRLTFCARSSLIN
jgi:hypothetical protein